jgi:hypothetical protein
MPGCIENKIDISDYELAENVRIGVMYTFEFEMKMKMKPGHIFFPLQNYLDTLYFKCLGCATDMASDMKSALLTTYGRAKIECTVHVHFERPVNRHLCGPAECDKLQHKIMNNEFVEAFL